MQFLTDCHAGSIHENKPLHLYQAIWTRLGFSEGATKRSVNALDISQRIFALQTEELLSQYATCEPASAFSDLLV
jgi:hypothetical protein